MSATATHAEPKAAARTSTRRDASRAVVRAALSVPGHPLAPHTRAQLEGRFGHDLGDVRVHTDDLAAAAARELDAHAFTVGRELFFAHGAFRPDTESGAALLEHEIAHAIAAPRAPAEAQDAAAPASRDGDALETSAHAASDALRAGRTPVVGAVRESDVRFARAASGLIARTADGKDPAQVVDALVQSLRSGLLADADDRSGRVRRTLIRLDERTRRLVLDALQTRLASADWSNLLDVLSRPLPAAGDQGTPADANAPAETKGEGEAEGAHAGEAPEHRAGRAEASGRAQAEAPAGTAPEVSGAVQTEAEGGAPQADAAAADVDKPALDGAQPKAAAESAEGAAAGGAAAHAAEPAGGAPPSAAGGAAGAEPAAVPGPEPVLRVRGVAVRSDAQDAGPDHAPAAAADRAEPATETAASSAELPAEAAPAATTGTEAPAAAGPAQAEQPAPPAAPEPPAEAGPLSAMPQIDEAPEAAPTAAEPEMPAELPAEPVTAESTAAAPDGSAASGGADAAPAPEAAAPNGSADAGAMGAVQVDLGPETGGGDADVPSGGGGGGGSAIPDTPKAEVVAPAGAPPASALQTLSAGTPSAVVRGLGTVRDSVATVAAQGRQELADAPPSVERPTGAPRDLALQPAAAPAATPGAVTAPARAGGGTTATPVAATPAVGAGIPVPTVRAPAVTANAEGKLTAADVQHLAQTVDELPTTDPALDVTVGDVPKVTLDGEADPAQADAERDALAQTTAATAKAGALDAAAPLGEDGIVPTVRPETLKATIPAAASGGGGAGPAAEAADLAEDDPVAIIADRQQGAKVRAEAGRGASDVTAQDEQKTKKMSDERASTAAATDAAITDSANAQAAERNETRAAVRKHRAEWTTEQKDAVDGAGREGDDEVTAAHGEAVKQRDLGNAEAAEHVDEGNRRITTARTDAEKTARTQRDKAKEESDSGGFWDRVASAVGSFFSAIKDAIHSAFDAARKAVSAAISWAKKAVADVIDKARNLVVAALKAAGKALTAISDRLLAGFPALRDRFRGLIEKAVDGAVAAVNKFADDLKAGITKLLDLLGAALTALLDAYEKALTAIVSAVADVAQSVIKFAKAVAEALGEFLALVKDVASGPGQWLKNLGAGIVDGIKNHLWREFKAAVKEWFNSKVEAVVGVGKMVFEVLKHGGIPFGRIASMVWTAVKTMLPRAIAELLVERLVAMLVPAAAAIMAIIDGLKAAWATASRILAAFKLFFAFLRAVKSGSAGQPFAKALAAAAIAVIDFIANFLISKLMKGAKNVGSKLKGIADKLMAFFRKGAALAKRGASAVKNAVVAAAKWTGKQIVRAGKAIAKSPVGKALVAAARYIAKSPVGKFVAAQYKKVRDGIKGAVDRFKSRKRTPQTEAERAARRDRVVAAVRPRLTSMLSRGVAGLRMRATLAAWRLWYRIRQLAVVNREIVAANSPSVAIMNVMVADSAMIMSLVRSVGLEVLSDPRVVAAEERIAAQRAAGKGTSAKNPIRTGTGVDLLGGARDVSLIHSSRVRNPLFGTKTATGLPHDRYITPRRGVGTSEVYGLPGVKRDLTFSEMQKGGSAGLVFIPQLGDYGIEDPKRDIPWKWIQARKSLGPAGGKPLTDAELAGTLRRYMRGGQFDESVVGTKTRSGNPSADRLRSLKFLGGMSRLMGSVESGRDPSAIVDSSVMLGLMERNRVSAANAFEQQHSAGALYPSALSGAFGANTAAAQRTLALPESQDLATNLQADKISQERAREHEATLRRLRLIGELVHERMQLAEEMFTNEAAVRHFVEQNLRNLLYAEIEATYNLNLKAKVLLFDASGRPMVFH